MFDLTPDEARLLLNIALMSTGHNRFKSAATILAGLGLYRSEEPSLATANVILFLSMEDYEGAVNYVETVALKKFPDSPMLRTFYGIALEKSDRLQDARSQWEIVVQTEKDPAAVQMAKDLLNKERNESWQTP